MNFSVGWLELRLPGIIVTAGEIVAEPLFSLYNFYIYFIYLQINRNACIDDYMGWVNDATKHNLSHLVRGPLGVLVLCCIGNTR